jgi:CheY-like chemotaxis protein
VLLVEDNEKVREVAAAMLEALGCETVTAGSAREALEVFPGSEIDVLFTDCVMPGEVDGPGLAMILEKKKPSLAILFTSDDQLDPCHGNLPIISVAPDLPAILTATNTKTKDATVPVVEAALRELTRYLHDRPQVAVRYAPLAGQSITIDKSNVGQYPF